MPEIAPGRQEVSHVSTTRIAPLVGPASDRTEIVDGTGAMVERIYGRLAD